MVIEADPSLAPPGQNIVTALRYSPADNMLYVLTQKDWKLRAYSIEHGPAPQQFCLQPRHEVELPAEGLCLLLVEAPLPKAILVGLADGSIKVFPSQGDPYNVSEHYEGTGVYALDQAPLAGVVLSGGQDGTVKFWQFSNGGRLEMTHSFDKMGYVTCLKLVRDELLFVGGMNGVCAMHLPKLQVCGRVNTGPVLQLRGVVGTDQMLFVICLDGTIRVLSIRFEI